MATPTNYDEVTNFFDTSSVEGGDRATSCERGARRDDRGQVDDPRGVHRADARRARRRDDRVLPGVPARGPCPVRQPAPVTHRGRRPVRARQAVRRPAAGGRDHQGRPDPADRPHRGRGDQAVRQHLPRPAGRVLQRAGHLRRDPRPGHRADHRGRRPGPADRVALQQPVLRVRRLLPAQGHQAAPGQLRRRPAEPDQRGRGRQHHPQGLRRRRHPAPQPEDGRRLPPGDEVGVGQLPGVQHPGHHEAHQGQGRRGHRVRAQPRTRTSSSPPRSSATSTSSSPAPTSSSRTAAPRPSTTSPRRSTRATSTDATEPCRYWSPAAPGSSAPTSSTRRCGSVPRCGSPCSTP